jgi:hypothetical protein
MNDALEKELGIETPTLPPTPNAQHMKVRNYALRFKGMYRGLNENGALLSRLFDVRVRVPMVLFDDPEANPIALFRKNLAERVLKAKYHDYTSVQTVELIEAEIERSKEVVTDIRICNRDTLIQYMKANKIEIDNDLYPTADEMRTAIRLYKEDPSGYKAMEGKMSKHKRLQIEQATMLSEMDLLIE